MEKGRKRAGEWLKVISSNQDKKLTLEVARTLLELSLSTRGKKVYFRTRHILRRIDPYSWAYNGKLRRIAFLLINSLIASGLVEVYHIDSRKARLYCAERHVLIDYLKNLLGDWP